MLNVVGCITQEHDLRLVALAALICAVASFTMFNLLARLQAAERRLDWVLLCVAAGVFGGGVWSLHFVAMLAYRPDLPIAFDIAETVASVVIAGFGALLSLVVWRLPRSRMLGVLAGGVLLGLSVAGMHYTGVAAMRLPGTMALDQAETAASVLISVGFAMLALARSDKLEARARRIEVSGWLALSICGLHFTGMTALSITLSLGPGQPLDSAVLGSELLAMAVGSVSLGILLLGLVATIMEQHQRLKLLRQQTTLAKFGEFALRSDDLDQILTEACHLVGHALGTDLAKVMELQDDGQNLLLRAGVGWKPGVVGEVTVRVMDNTSEGYALKTGEPMVSPDIAKETRFEYPPFLVDNGVKAVANVVVIGGQGRPPFGILQVDSRVPRRFTRGDVTFLRGYANLLAAVVDRLRTTWEARNGEAHLRLILDASAMGSWDFNLASGAVTRTTRHDQIFGYPDLLPAWNYAMFLDHVVPEDRERMIEVFSRAVEAEAEWRFECRIRRADNGEVRWIEARGRPGGVQDGRPTCLLGTLADITDRKHAEEALQRHNEMLEASVAKRTHELTVANAQLEAEAVERERVEEALRQSQKMEAVGQLTGGIAHDFNNLLQGISGSLELMRARVAQGRTAAFDHYIDTALTSANRAAALTHRLLAFSRRQTLVPKLTDMNKLVGGMEEMLCRTVGPSIRIETSLVGEPWPTLCDPNQLENVLLNLVINARDAMPDGGQLLIETTNTVLRDRRGRPKEWPPQDVPPGEYAALSVADTGTGMAPDVLARAFDPFFTTKPIGQGTGLGLSMVYGFVQQSGGHIRLRSEEGQGTTVAIYLPRHFGATVDAATVGTTALVSAVTGKVVLVVEDEPSVRMVVRDVLSDLGHTVLEAESGQAGLNIMASKAHIDLLLTDVGLPDGMNGRQLADAARQHRPGLKVLFITGYAASAAVGNGRMEQGMDVMSKPFTTDALAAKVQDIIEHC